MNNETIDSAWGDLFYSTKEIRALAEITPKPIEQLEEMAEAIQQRIKHGDSKFFVVIHDNDPDGHAANAIFRACIPLDVRVLSTPVTHGKPFADFVGGIDAAFQEGGDFYGADAVVVLDHAVSGLNAAAILTAMKEGQLLIIDHHPETIDAAAVMYEDLVVLKDLNWSTAGLCALLYNHFYVTTAPVGMREVIKNPLVPATILGLLVSYYDLWRFGQTKNIDGENAARAIAAIAFHDGFETIDWGAITNHDYSAMVYSSGHESKAILLDVIGRGKALLDIKSQVAYKVVTKSLNKRLICLPPANDPEKLERAMVGVLFHSDDIDNVAAAALKLHEDLDLVAVIYLKADGGTPFKLAIRGRNGSMLTARDVATYFGGGGHPCSAGAQISDIADFFKHTHAIES